jgi:hypothetical protein
LTAIVFGIGAIAAALFITNLNDRVTDNDDKITRYTNYITTLEEDSATYTTQQTAICSTVSLVVLHKMYTCYFMVLSIITFNLEFKVQFRIHFSGIRYYRLDLCHCNLCSCNGSNNLSHGSRYV